MARDLDLRDEEEQRENDERETRDRDEGASNEKLLDLYWDVYDRTGSRVTVRW